MTARAPQLRNKTAREVAQKLGVSPRTVRRYVAAPRDWWEDHRRAMRAKAVALRSTGMTWAQIGEELGCSDEAARAMAKRAASEQIERDPNTGDLFAQGNAQ